MEHSPTQKDGNAAKSSGKAVEHFKCIICREFFKDKSLLQHHIDTKHPRRRPFKCTGCSRRYARKKNANHHQQKLCPDAKVVNVAHDEPPTTYPSITVGVPLPPSITNAEEGEGMSLQRA